MVSLSDRNDCPYFLLNVLFYQIIMPLASPIKYNKSALEKTAHVFLNSYFQNMNIE